MALLIGITPLEQPDPALAQALLDAGALGVLDLGRDRERAAAALATLARRATGFGVRLPEDGAFDPADLPAAATTVITSDPAAVAAFRGRRVLVQVTSLSEARAGLAANADGLIVKGNESGGRVGDETTFVLLQRISAELPEAVLWAQGGIGLHTAAAAIAGGAHGVVLDSQLALLAESSLPQATKDVIATFDGSETTVVAGRRGHARLGLSVGQDAAFARPLAARFQRTAPLVRGMRQAIRGHLRLARALRPLAPGSPLAVAHGIRYPIAQGPMTRVSDRASFAAAVADAGGLPFLALSLMRGAEARRLLEETRSLLAGRAWGVGILGFLPPALREEQLALIKEFRPPVALIAGGRPAQAASLEDVETATYLHAPSPGLLDQFLKDGARRFVLEGRECGGHVGPRSSFVLWESAIERFLTQAQLDRLSVLFAGGVHDARSAAMVAAAAAPIAARGAKIGVLAGTAYLFTKEAVASGAIQPGYQRAALDCARTTLLETGPGHATRCIDSEYVRAFRAERSRLEEEGVDPRTMWESLEQLNLGRLRVAAKGVVREGGALRDVDDDAQRREGMFMIGQVGALRHGIGTISALHESVSRGSVGHLEALEPAHGSPPAPVDVAIVGMASIFPGAPDLASFWANIVHGRDSITEVPPERWNPDLYFDPDGTGDKTPSKWGGFLPEVVFDPAAYGIPPRSLAAIEPVQLLALEVARRALEDAGYGDRPFDRERASVIFGAESGTDLSGAYGFRAQHAQFLGPIPPALDERLPRLTEDSFPGVLTNVIAGRIANRLDLGGMNYTVDAACASSLAAVDAACKELVAGTSDLVLCGGADLHNSINDYLMFASVHALSPRGRCQPFDASADGIVLGEGVAVIVLKRLPDAIRDGDRVYAVIKGTGASSDGKSLGLTAPRKDGQVRAIERAYDRAGVSPADVELAEAHGTGTVVGDRTELATLTEIWESAGALPGAVTLGSVKSQIGHTKCAAGMAGLVKTALAIHHRVLPPMVNLQRTNPAYDAASSPFVFRTAAAPWASASPRAGISAFGFGGTNFHVVLEGLEGTGGSLDEWSHEIVVVRGTNRDDAEVNRTRLLALAGHGHRLRDIARTAAALPGSVWLAVVAADVAELATKLRAPLTEAGTPGPVALLFPGQGSQRPGMLAELFVTFAAELRPLLTRGRGWLSRLFPGAALTPAQVAAQQAAITDTRVAQPALGLADLAVARLLQKVGVRAAMLAGHSYGELVALCVAGAIPEEALLYLSAARAQAILDAARGAPGTMAAVTGPAEGLARLIGEDVTVANYNAPDQTVIAGSDAAVEEAIARLDAAGVRARRLPVACAFHSPIVAGAAAAFEPHLAEANIGSPVLPVYSNTNASPYPAGPQAVRALLAQHLVRPVRFREEIEAMYAAGARIFVEAGPGAVLTNLVNRILADRPHLAVACAPHGQPALRSFLGALAQLLGAGTEIDVNALFAGRDAQLLDLDGPPSASRPSTAWLVNGMTARPLSGELPDFAMKPNPHPVVDIPAPESAQSPREAAVLKYLQAMGEIVENEREIMLRYLGTAPAPADRTAEPIVPGGSNGDRERSSEQAPAPEPTALAPTDPLAALAVIVSERTGYPAEMLDPDLDLEADLSIDSIKRIEILGVLGERLGVSTENATRSALVEALASLKTMRAIADRLAALTAEMSDGHDGEHNPGAEGNLGKAEDAPSTVVTPVSPTATEGGVTLRYHFAPTPLPPPNGDASGLRGRRFAIAGDDAGVGEALARLLRAHGAEPRLLRADEALGKVDGLVHLEALSVAPVREPCRTLFVRAKEAIGAGVPALWAVTAQGGAFGEPQANGRRPQGGIAGLVKSLVQEVPDLRARVVSLDLARPAEALAATVFAELLDDGPVEVGYVGSQRHARRLVPGERNGTSHRLAGPGSPVLGPESVILATGGGRGITAAVAIALATRYRCRLELVGRSPLTEPEDQDLLACPDGVSLRRVLAGRNGKLRNPAALEGQVRRILAARAARATLAAIEHGGGHAAYHACDVRDDVAFGALIERVYAEHDRIDVVIHGAGVIEDRLLSAKTPESFDRVFGTKVRSARTLVEKLRDDVQMVVFFSSIAGACGNRGQTDYAAANDALDGLAHYLWRRLPGRVVSIGWGPWAGAGMVTPELEREYARRGIDLIPAEEGVQRFLDEMASPDAAHVVVVHRSAAKILSP